MLTCTFLLMAAALSCADPKASDDCLPPHFSFASFTRADDALQMRAEKRDGPAPDGWQAGLVIDGHVTDAPWPGSFLSSWKVSDEVYLLHDHYSGRQSLYLWSSEASSLRDIGQGHPKSIANVGTFVVRREPEELSAREDAASWSVSNFNPMKGEPRRLATHVGKPNSVLTLLGRRGNGLVLRLGSDFITLTPGERPIVKQFELKAWRPAGSDGVRGSKLLLVGAYNAPQSSGEIKAYECDVGLLDLNDGTIRNIGTIPGGWTGHTAVPHPHVDVAWISRGQIQKLGEGMALMRFPLGGLGFGPTGYVREDTLRTWPPKPMDE